jgi:hypothetical protein
MNGSWKKERNNMSKVDIDNIQDFLTVVREDENKKHQIVCIELLLRRHPPAAVISFLTDLHKDYTRKLKKVIREDKTSCKLDEIIAAKFRIKMAINSIRNYANEGGRTI